MFCFVTKTGKYIGIDNLSGGYPYETTRELSIKLWDSKEKAENYKSMFPKEDWVMKEFLGINLRDA